MRLQRSSLKGTIFPGLILGLVIGLAIAAFIAWTWNKEPSYNDRIRADQEKARIERERGGQDQRESQAARQDEGNVANRPADQRGQQDRERFDFYKILPGIEEAHPVQGEQSERGADNGDQLEGGAEGRRNPYDSESKRKDIAKKESNRSVAEEERLNQVMDKLQEDGEVGDREVPRSPKQRRWLVQAGAFENEAEAESMKADLAMSGLEAHVTRGSDEQDNEVYRVRVGPLLGDKELARVQSELRRQGIKAATIPLKGD